MQHTRQGPRWWHTWVPFLLLGGLLVLEPHAPLSPGGHQGVQLAITLLMYGVVLYWLRRNRGALVYKEYEREQAQVRTHTARQRRRDLVMGDDEPWDEAESPGRAGWVRRRYTRWWPGTPRAVP